MTREERKQHTRSTKESLWVDGHDVLSCTHEADIGSVGVTNERHQAELRRVAEAAQHDLWYALKAALGPGKHQQVLSRETDLARDRLDAVIRGAK